MISRLNLDKRIRDVEIGTSNNNETYREFIVDSERRLGIEPRNLDRLSDEQLRDYLEELDYIWMK